MCFSISDLIKSEASYLLDEMGFRIVSEDFNSRHFGNSYAELSNKEFSVRFVRDKGQYFAEFASLSDQNKWWEFSKMLELLKWIKK